MRSRRSSAAAPVAVSYVGTTDFRVVCAKVVEGDPKFTEAYQALVYQLSKDIGAMASVLHFDVDAIVYTGGMAYEQFFCDDITTYVGKIAPVIRMPGEEEMRSLAEARCACSTASRRPASINS